MGEYANFGGERIKIGTCEDMYYLRLNQRSMVDSLPGNVNTRGEDVYSLRFRFPWPDEDNTLPGGFDNYDRAIAIHGAKVPDGVDHHSIQFRNDRGLLCSLPCPNGPAPHLVKIHKNGYAGDVQLVRQKLLRDGRAVPILKCGGCGALWRVEEQAEIEELARILMEQQHAPEFYGEIARRMLQGAGASIPAPQMGAM